MTTVIAEAELNSHENVDEARPLAITLGTPDGAELGVPSVPILCAK